MVLYVGEAVIVRVSAVNPLTKQVIADATATADFYAPGKKPAKNPDDRDTDKPQVPLAYDADSQAYIAYVDTDGWAAGKWTCRVMLTGTYDSWEYFTFVLKA